MTPSLVLKSHSFVSSPSNLVRVSFQTESVHGKFNVRPLFVVGVEADSTGSNKIDIRVHVGE